MWVVTILHDLTEAIEKARLYEQLKEASASSSGRSRKRPPSSPTSDPCSPFGSVRSLLHFLFDLGVRVLQLLEQARFSIFRSGEVVDDASCTSYRLRGARPGRRIGVALARRSSSSTQSSTPLARTQPPPVSLGPLWWLVRRGLG